MIFLNCSVGIILSSLGKLQQTDITGNWSFYNKEKGYGISNLLSDGSGSSSSAVILTDKGTSVGFLVVTNLELPFFFFLSAAKESRD